MGAPNRTPRTPFPSVMAVSVALLTSCATGGGSTLGIDFETGEATKLAFDLSPDGRTIVFDLLGQLWTIPIEGGQAIPLTNAVQDTSEDLDPVFSPDGSSVVFRADRPGGTGLFIVSLSDRSVRRLTDQSHLAPSWSPDGQKIAFVQGQSIQMLDPAGGDPENLQIDSLPRPVSSHPTWQPVDGRLLFVNASQGARYGGSLWEVFSEGGVARAVGDSSLRARAPAYSPDGRLVAFFSPDSASRFQLWVLEPGAEPFQLTDQDDVTPLRTRWLPDGSELVYHAGGRLWTIPAIGGSPTEIPFTARVQLSRESLRQRPVRFAEPETDREARGHMGLALSPGGARVAMIALGQLWAFEVGAEPAAVAAMPPTATGLSWSPDERSVVWSAGPGGAEDLYATDLSTGRTRQVTALPGSETGPSWSPDGHYVAFIHWEKPTFSTPASDYSDAGTQLRVIPVSETIVESTAATMDLGGTFTTWGFLGPNQDAPMWSPDSQPSLLFVQGQSLVQVPLSGERRQSDISANPTWVSWSADRNLVYVEDGLLWRASFDADSATLGEANRISDDAALYASTSRDGSVLYMSPDGLRIHRPDGRVEDLGWPLMLHTPAPAPLLVRNIRLVDGSGERSDEPVDFLTEGGRIVRVGPAGTLGVGDGVRVVDAGGRTAIPGLIDLHAHLWDDAVLTGALFNGVTTLRDMGSTGIARLAGFRDAIDAGIWPGPRIVLGGVQFWGTGTMTAGGGYMVSDDSSRTRATDLVGAFRTDYLKTRLFSDWAGAAKLVEAAHKRGWPVSGHIGLPLPLIAAGIDGMEHLGPSGFRTDEIVYDDIIQLFRNSNMWIIPTVIGYSSVVRAIDDPTIFDDSTITPFLKWWGLRLPPNFRIGYDRFARLTRTSALKLYEGGVIIAAGSDAPVLPWALHAELEELVAAGLSPLAAINAATQTAAQVLGASDEIGTIEEGKWADLVILNADPLGDIKNTRDIWMVIKGGVEVDRELLRGWVERSASVVEVEGSRRN